MPPRLTDERLCWLAVADTLRRRKPSVRWIFIGCVVFAVSGVLYAARNLILGHAHGKWFLPLLPLGALVGTAFMIRGVVSARQMNSARMMQYSLAVKAASEKLSDEERMRLRAEGDVPPWFLDEVERQRRTVKI
jgi:hypothetical protein